MASVGTMELLILALICLIPIVLVLLAAVIALAVVLFRKEDRRPAADEDRTSAQGETHG